MARCLKSFDNDHHAEKNNFLQGVVTVPARRALENKKIDSLEKLSYFSENEIMQLHGFGKNTMKKLKNYMQEQRVSFKKN
ncbi:hypothetical protein [Chryseobacterium sp.]|jgi:DNA-directed RNA polymerase alpha subunit|uniref:hypothetical protein n=1 Tax=Chryseobacterium sp. TaxID=1871047 RepID=UPI002620D765|nr:hypothetical protein [Chryseobacterium sp.]